MKKTILVMALVCVHTANATPPAKEHPQARAQQEKAAVKPAPDNIGHATMLQDRTIVVSLIYSFPGGGHTMPAEFRYKPGDAQYEEVLRHLGGMKPGESKGVKPWPTTTNTPPVSS